VGEDGLATVLTIEIATDVQLIDKVQGITTKLFMQPDTAQIHTDKELDLLANAPIGFAPIFVAV
jgi:hypothetical protein